MIDKAKILEIERRRAKGPEARPVGALWAVDDSLRYVIDRSGDRMNLIYGGLYRGDIPVYTRFSILVFRIIRFLLLSRLSGLCLGLSPNQYRLYFTDTADALTPTAAGGAAVGGASARAKPLPAGGADSRYFIVKLPRDRETDRYVLLRCVEHFRFIERVCRVSAIADAARPFDSAADFVPFSVRPEKCTPSHMEPRFLTACY